jgi:flagella basal body P-ring formation protein FlgA
MLLLTAATSSADDTLEKYLSDKVITDYGLDPDYTEINLVRSNLRSKDIDGFEIKAYPMLQSDPRGRFPMQVELYRNDELVNKGSVSLDVSIFADLPVPVRNIKRHEILTPNMFRIERFEITSLTEKLLCDIEHIKDCRAKHHLVAGRKVSFSRIEKIPVVEQGQTVTIVGSNQFFEIRAKGIALEDGNLGESIKVKNVDSRKILWVEVMAQDLVKVAL